MTLGERLKKFRTEKGYSQKDLAEFIGVSKVTLIRWENGTSKPSNLSAQHLQGLGFGNIELHETKAVSIPRISNSSNDSTSLRSAVQNKIRIGPKSYGFDPAPYVINGPQDQLDFFNELYSLQATKEVNDIKRKVRSLSIVSAIPSLQMNTAQYDLEHPKKEAKHWNPNYGSHGWHRYVGRFPPHLIRAILNYFNFIPEEVVCDPFVGSGTTLLECRLLGLKAVGVDICPLSTRITRAKSQFPLDTSGLEDLYQNYTDFYLESFNTFKQKKGLDHSKILSRKGNQIEPFSNYEKWLIPEAFLGTSITVEFISKLNGYESDFILCALSSAMRSIGNVDVDVVRAEYSKKPRKNVDVLSLVQRKLRKMILDIKRMTNSHSGLLSNANDINVMEGSLLNAKIRKSSINYIITSPPYGVETISYLRTHLLSYRCLNSILNYNPYGNDSKFIGSEYLNNGGDEENWIAATQSNTFKMFFSDKLNGDIPLKLIQRRNMMMKFFSEMVLVARKCHSWLKKNGKVAFVIGNKKIGEFIIPADIVISEIFENNGFKTTKSIKHKLKCNNSNSEVPWQEKIIQDEYVLFFEKKG